MVKILAAQAPAGIWPNGQQYAGAGGPTVYDSANANRTALINLENTGTRVTILWNNQWVPGPSGDHQICIVDSRAVERRLRRILTEA
jgi:hypothetical protein